MDGINRIIEVATKLGGKSGGGGGGKGPPQGEDAKEEEKQRNSKKDGEEKHDPLKDKDGKDGTEPKSPEKAPKNSDEPKGKVPPPKSPLEPPVKVDPRGVFFAQLPAKVREAVLAGDFDQVPERYRDLIREWTKKLAEAETKDAAK